MATIRSVVGVSWGQAHKSRSTLFVVVFAVLPGLFLLGVCLGWATTAEAAPPPRGSASKRGLLLADQGNCVDAVPLLEEAETKRHAPETAMALAGCLVVLGDLVRASDLYASVARERPRRDWSARDRRVHREAEVRASEVEARVPRLLLEVDRSDAPDLQVAIDGRPVVELGAPIRMAPDTRVVVEAFAEGFRPFREEHVLREGQRLTVRIRLLPGPSGPRPTPVEGAAGDVETRDWIGARFRGVLMPQFLMNLAADGGATIYIPGGGLTYTRETDGGPDISIGVQYAAYQMGATAFKPRGTPDTEWEIVESDLHTTIASVDLLWGIPLDDAGTVELRLGAGVGLGIAFAGDLYRWQAYPPAGREGDPSLWEKCRGPNDPAGTFRYCNQLDKDRDRYGQVEPYWHEDGLRPLFFPWLSIPQVGLTFHATPRYALDLEVGATLNGLLTGIGMRGAL